MNVLRPSLDELSNDLDVPSELPASVEGPSFHEFGDRFSGPTENNDPITHTTLAM